MTSSVSVATGAGRPRLYVVKAGEAGPQPAAAGASPATVVRLLSLANGTGVEALASALAGFARRTGQECTPDAAGGGVPGPATPA